jgi:hypothetical protein
LITQKQKLDEIIFKFVEDGKCKFGAILAYGSGNDYAADRVRELSRLNRVGTIKRMVAVEMLADAIDAAQKFIDEINAQTVAVDEAVAEPAVTQLQAAMLKKIAFDEFTPANGSMPSCAADTETWADQVIETAQDKGVFTSLLNAKLVWHRGSGREGGVGLTEQGYQILVTLTKQNG